MHLSRIAHPAACIAILAASTVAMATPRDYLIANMSGEPWTLKLSAVQPGHGLSLFIDDIQDLKRITTLAPGAAPGSGHDIFIIRPGEIVKIRITEEPELAGPPLKLVFNLVDSGGKASPDFTLSVSQKMNEFATCRLGLGGPDHRFLDSEDKRVLFILRERDAAG